ncbi:hypothetical protein [Candidatus Parabeggiatoa sp. HSG14]|uniref:hypothetical protein n=1 Tax=Candidatus Parabeggiatoa sp. HSG14 TaxID=3055593 RepID=UPI0025A742E8|nr:hypothetical protein [Thiotrichales bacterium HSG14]
MATEAVPVVQHGIWAASVKPFLLAHPIGVALVGGALVGVGSYYLMKKFSKKPESEEATPEPAAA